MFISRVYIWLFFFKKRIFKKTTSIMFFCIKIYGKAIIPKGFLRVIKVL